MPQVPKAFNLSSTDHFSAKLLPTCHRRTRLFHRGDMGRTLQRLRIRTAQRRTRRLDLWIHLLLGRVGGNSRHDGRTGEYVAYHRWTIPLDVYACAQGVEGGIELYHWVVCTVSFNEAFGTSDVINVLCRRQSTIAWQAVTASSAYLTATSLQGLVINSQPSYVPKGWHGTMLVIALMSVAMIFSTVLSKYFARIESCVLVFHLLLFVALIIVLTVMAPEKSSNENVWELFLNEGGYESKGVSFFVCLVTPIFAFTGVDGAVHMSEEIRNASRVVPWALSRTSA